MKLKRMILCAALAATAFSGLQAQSFSWKKSSIDGRLTGVTIPKAGKAEEALGSVDSKGNYMAPDGHVFKAGSSVAAAASLMLDAQDEMAQVKEVIGYAPREMKRRKPQCELSNWFVDFLMQATEEKTGRHVDVSIYNFGGIRADMPEGDITVDDIMGMFPFKNTLCYVELKGSDLLAIYKWLAETHMQAVGGVRLTVRDHKLESVFIGDEPLDVNKIYGVATINFLLNGGDGLNIAKNAKDLVITDLYVKDAVIPYIRSLTAAGKQVEYSVDDRVTIIDTVEE